MAQNEHDTRSLDRLLETVHPDLKAQLLPLRRGMRAAGNGVPHIRNTMYSLIQFDLWLPHHDISIATRADIENWLGECMDKYSVPTVTRHRAGLRIYYKRLKDLGLRADTPMDGVRLAEAPESDKDIVPLADIQRVLAGEDKAKRYGPAAILSTLLDTGMRSSELCSTLLTNVDFDEQTVFIPAMNSKTKKDRLVGYTDQTADRLDRWVALRKDKSSPWLFTGQPDNGRAMPYTRSGLLQLVKRVFKRYGLEGIGTHDLRHTWTTHSLNHPDARETDIMAQGGWSSTRMLGVYGRKGKEQRAARANRTTSPLAQLQ
jgi:integrase